MEFQTCGDFAKSSKEFQKKNRSGRGCGSEPGRPKSGGLPGARLAESVRRRLIQIGRRAGLLLRGTAHADAHSTLGLGFGRGDAYRGAPMVSGGQIGGGSD
jgi:hypothetical protein